MLEDIFKDKHSIHYNKGETLCKQDAIANQLLLIEEGYAKIYIERKDKGIILSIMKPHDIIGLNNLFHDELYSFSVAAVSDCRVKAISSSEFNDLLSNDITTNNEVIEYINNYTSDYFSRFISLTQKQLHGRLADAIINLAEEVYQRNDFELHLSRKDIAEYTGMSTESAIRIIKEFHNDKLIELYGKRLKVVSMKLLKKLSDLG